MVDLVGVDLASFTLGYWISTLICWGSLFVMYISWLHHKKKVTK